MDDSNKKVLVNKEKCTGCGKCVSICPQNILYIDEDSGKCEVLGENLCDEKRGCEKICPAEAIKIICK